MLGLLHAITGTTSTLELSCQRYIMHPSHRQLKRLGMFKGSHILAYISPNGFYISCSCNENRINYSC